MSAETIPAEVQVLAKIDAFEKDYAGSIYIGGAHLNRHLWPLLQEVRATLEAERARADAAEQRAADALARAEKAAEDERDRLYAEAKGMEGVDSSIAAGWLRYLGPAMLPADRAILRASREAQPATDGGEA